MLEERLKDELHDVVHYSRLCRESVNELDRQILKDIAHDEYSHASHLADMMRRHGDYKEPTEEWKYATEAIKSLK